MSQNRKQDFQSYPQATGFIRAQPPQVTLNPRKRQAIEAYRKQAHLAPLKTDSKTHSEPQSLQEISSPEDVNLEDLLDSDRKAA